MAPFASKLFLALGLAWFGRFDADVRSALERLRAETAAERSEAQRWLARHLEGGDLDLLRAASIAGDAESRRRIALALADDERHLELALELASSTQERVREVGRSAITEMLLRWSLAWSRPGLPRGDALAKLAGRFDRPIALDPRTKDRRIDLALDQLARFAPGAPPLVLDPELALSDHPREASEGIEGTFDRVLGDLTRVHRADLEGVALDVDIEDAARPWIRVRRAVAEDRMSAADHVVDWCVAVASADRTGTPGRRTASARAIAATGWPGGIAWLERRWIERKDEAALEGVLLAAGRGQVSPSIARPETLRELLGLLHDEVEGSRRIEGSHQDVPRADAIARAIGAAGPCGPHGEDLAAIAAENLTRLTPREQWLRLVALEGLRTASPAATAAVDALLAARTTPAPVGFQALRARAALGSQEGSAPAIADPRSLLAWADGAGRGDECARLLVELEVDPPAGPPTGQDLALPRPAELEWMFHRGDEASTARRLLLLSKPVVEGGLGLEALSNRTRIWVRQGARARFERVISAARSLEGPGSERPDANPTDRLERLLVLSGAADDKMAARWIGRLSAAATTREDLLCLAALAAEPAGSAARDALVGCLSAAKITDDVVAALDRAVLDLRARRLDEEERALVRAVRQAVREAAPEVRVRLRVDAWPPRTAPEVLRPAELDRTLERSGL